jgi:hypothetical protein
MITIALVSLQLLLVLSLIYPMLANGLIIHGKTTSTILNESTMPTTKIRNFGMWAPYQLPLESIKNTTEQKDAINAILKQGYNEYYFAMGDFKSKTATSMAENLLQSADGTKLKIIIILLPPSEAGPKGNFDWDGWIKYLNYLKAKHPSSLDGFVIDDFNLFYNNVHTIKNKGNNSDNHYHYVKNSNNHNVIKENVSFMLKSNLENALQKKRKDLHFYPLLYFEGINTNDVKRYYYSNIDGIILASTDYYNITGLAHDIHVFSKVFNNKPIRYVVYTARTSRYIEQNYSQPSDRLILSTLSVANQSGIVNGIVVWRNTNSHVIHDYLSNMNNTQYVSFVSMEEELQLRDENASAGYGIYNNFLSTFSTQQEQQQSLDNNSHHHHHNNSHHHHNNNYKSNNRKSKGDHSSIMPTSSSSSPLTPRLGISAFDLIPALAEDMGLPKNYKGAVVQSVITASPAYKAGIRGATLDVNESGYLIRKGDVIIAVDGHKIKGAEDIVKQMEKKLLGDLVSIIVNRNGQIINFVVKLEPLSPQPILY